MAANLAYGFASMNGGTSGGSGGRVVRVDTGSELQAAINSARSGPVTILVEGRITLANSGADRITIEERSNISIIGAGSGAEFDGIGLHVKDGSSNLIFQNLQFRNVQAGTGDAISIEGPSRNIWIDRNDFSSSRAVHRDFFDGLVEIKRGAEYITVSRNHFHDHHKASLVGFSDNDEGARFVTYAHNLFENIGSRTPSIRFGFAHIYENYYKNIDVSAINLRMGAQALVENNVFENVRNPIVSFDSDEIGFWTLRGNVFRNTSYSSPDDDEAIAGTANRSTGNYSVPYTYTLVGAANVPSYVLAQAGAGTGAGTGGTQQPLPSDPVPTVPGGAAGEATGDDDSINGTAGDDVIDALGGADRVNGGAGDDRINGGSNDDTLVGGEGADTLLGGDGRDSLSGGSGTDVLDGGSGADTLAGGGGADRLAGRGSDDRLLGGGGADLLEGGDGRDVLSGGAEGDTLIGGVGRDVLTGEGGADRFVLTGAAESSPDGSRDVITDWGAGDVIDLSRLDALPRSSGNDAFVFIGERAFSGRQGELRAFHEDGSTFVEADLNGDRAADLGIELTGVHSLAVSDFVL